MLIFYTFLARLSKREKLIFYGAAFFISLSLIDRLIVSPILSKIISLNKEIQEKEADIRRNLHILAQKDRILAEVGKYASLLSRLESSEGDITSLLKEIEILANETSVYLIDIKPVGLGAEEGQSKYLVKLSCEAQMEQITSFMYNIENSDKLLTIETYKINPKARESSIARCSMSISKRVKQ